MILFSVVRCFLSAVSLTALYGLCQLEPSTATLADVLSLLHNKTLQYGCGNLTLLFFALELVLPYLRSRKLTAATPPRLAAKAATSN